MTTLTLFTKPDCSLCDAARFVIDRAGRQIPFKLDIVDIALPENAAWHKRYKHDIPVVHINGREAFKHRLDEWALKRAIEEVAREE